MDELLRYKWIIKNFVGVILLVGAIILAQRYELSSWVFLMVFPGILIILGWNNPTVRDCKNL